MFEDLKLLKEYEVKACDPYCRELYKVYNDEDSHIILFNTGWVVFKMRTTFKVLSAFRSVNSSVAEIDLWVNLARLANDSGFSGMEFQTHRNPKAWTRYFNTIYKKQYGICRQAKPSVHYLKVDWAGPL